MGSLMKVDCGVATSKLYVVSILTLFLSLHATPSQAFDPSNDGRESNPFAFGAPSTLYYGGFDALVTERLVVVHAVIACVVWAFLVPVGGILLRLRLNSPKLVRVHAILQITSLVAYIAAVGVGIALVPRTNYSVGYVWNDAHPRLGLAILVMALFQPLLGYINHRIFKKRQANAQSGKSMEWQGRTIPGFIHLWLGRILIFLGMVNGGLGFRLAAASQFQGTTQNVINGYVVGVVIMSLIYLFFNVRFEWFGKRVPATAIARERPTVISREIRHEESPPIYVLNEGKLEVFVPSKVLAYEEKQKS